MLKVAGIAQRSSSEAGLLLLLVAGYIIDIPITDYRSPITDHRSPITDYKKFQIMIKYINLILFASVLVVNYLANALPLNHKTTGELSDNYPNLFVPAGLTFAIWGVIYLLLLGYCIVQFGGSRQLIVEQTGVFFAITCLLNIAWIFAWHYQKLPLSVIIILAFLVTLILVNINIRESSDLLVKAVFGIYLGWLCIATIANITALLVNYHWDGFGISEEAWTIIMIAAGTLIVCLSILDFKNPFIGLSVIWAFAGIIIKRSHDHPLIVMAAALCLIVVAVLVVTGFVTKAAH